jgi:hypothetical protein
MLGAQKPIKYRLAVAYRANTSIGLTNVQNILG